jgi:hypothetical protein
MSYSSLNVVSLALGFNRGLGPIAKCSRLGVGRRKYDLLEKELGLPQIYRAGIMPYGMR